MSIDDVRGTHQTQPSAGRGGFTLVELLAVIMIIALLAALVTPAVMRSLNSARNAAIKAEIDMLHMAIMNYKNEFGSFPPSYVPAFLALGTDVACKHLRRIFPRVAPGDLLLQAQSLSYMNLGSGTFAAAQSLTPDAAIVAWLFGYNDQAAYPVLYTNGGATLNSMTQTITVTGTVASRKKLFDFDLTRVKNYQYCPPSKPNSPYIYIDKSAYGTVGVSGSIPSFAIGSQTYSALRLPTAAVPSNFADPQQQPFNSDTFQILCAGQDEEFGTDDDLSNFWKGTRKDYLDSLK
jgi:prepilin-type N-terminal cleavage/methylation domain-containing protein